VAGDEPLPEWERELLDGSKPDEAAQPSTQPSAQAEA
jgi:hypothetical protein